MEEFITIKGAREHNLQNVDLKLPRVKMVVITGIRIAIPRLVNRWVAVNS